MTESTIIHLKNKTLKLDIKDFGDSAIDTEELLQVDMNNIIADIVTFPVLFNRISNIKADVDELLRHEQLDFIILEAQLYEEHKKIILAAGDKATENSVDMAVKRDPRFIAKKRKIITVQKEADVIDGLYWSAKSKDQKLNTISAKVQPDDFEKEVLEGTINSVMIRSYKHNSKTK